MPILEGNRVVSGSDGGGGDGDVGGGADGGGGRMGVRKK